MIVLKVKRESIVAELTASPNFEVTKPKVKKTSGEMTNTAKNHTDVNLFSFPAHIALIEFAERASNTATKIYNQT